MVEKFLSRTVFTSQEDYIRNFRIRVPADFNFAYDVVDAYAAEEPDKKALLWTDDRGGEIQFTFADMKRETDRTASYFQSLGIGRGDMVMLILKRRYEFWFSILALHKLGAVAIPATHLLTRKDVVYRCNMAGVKAIVAAGEPGITGHNAAATAEGTVQVILERLERSLLGSQCLVLGFGRIGKLLCHRLTAMGAHVTAAARRPESLAWAKAYGYKATDIGKLEGNLGAFDVVVNTVPEPIFGEDRLRELKPGCLCVDVASVQGIDLNAAEALGLEGVWARGLPGKLMPKTAGAVIRDTVYTIIKEQGVIL